MHIKDSSAHQNFNLEDGPVKISNGLLKREICLYLNGKWAIGPSIWHIIILGQQYSYKGLIRKSLVSFSMALVNSADLDQTPRSLSAYA